MPTCQYSVSRTCAFFHVSLTRFASRRHAIHVNNSLQQAQIRDAISESLKLAPVDLTAIRRTHCEIVAYISYYQFIIDTETPICRLVLGFMVNASEFVLSVIHIQYKPY
jgi:hypothetical protein